MTPVTQGIQAHSAPLQLAFLTDTAFPAPYQQGAVIALHGSWDRTVPTGYKVVYFPWNGDTQLPGTQIDLITGFSPDNVEDDIWGRPVGVAVDLAGALYVSDDKSGTVYKFVYTP
jgi:glucose/arabinose dehydrogenase